MDFKDYNPDPRITGRTNAGLIERHKAREVKVTVNGHAICTICDCIMPASIL